MLKKLEEHDSYKAASVRVRELRGELSGQAGVTVRMMHAETELHAEDLLNEVREAMLQPGDD